MVVALFRTLEFKKSQLPILISIDGSFYFTQVLLSPRRNLLLYYLYCLCKSVQRSLLFEECSFSKADAKVKTFKHILQIFSEVFF